MSKTKNYDELTYYINNPLYDKKIISIRKCVTCKKVLPADRYFNHDECIKDEDVGELYLESGVVLHAYGKNVL